MEISASLVKELREATGCGMMECKKALAECSGDLQKAVDYLRKHGLSQAEKKASRTTSEGIIAYYIHSNNKIGVMVDVACETDFVARNETFQAFGKDIAMHVCASSPMYLKKEDIPADFLAREREIYLEQARATGKPEAMVAKIAEGKLEKRLSEICLLTQPFVKNPEITVQEYLQQTLSKIGENMKIRRFVRFQIGEA